MDFSSNHNVMCIIDESLLIFVCSHRQLQCSMHVHTLAHTHTHTHAHTQIFACTVLHT